MATLRTPVASATSESTTTYTCDKPTGTAEGDVLVAFQTCGSFGNTSMTTPTGGATWQLLDELAESEWAGTRVWWKVAGASEPSTYTFSQSSTGMVVIAAIEGGSESAPDVAHQSDGDMTVTTPSVTAGLAPGVTLRWAAGYQFGASAFWSAPGGTTEQADLRSGDTTATLVSADRASSGATGTADITASGGGSFLYSQGITVDIPNGSVSATVDAAVVDAAGDVPAPTIKFGQTVPASVVDAAAEVGTVTMHAGQTASPSVVEAAGEVPAPNVVAGSAELVEPATVGAAAEVPSPTITAEQHRTLTPGVVGAAADVPAPSVSATRAWTVTPSVVDAQASVPSAGVTVPILPGELITQDGQVEWGGTALWGAGTSYALLEITGWDAKPSVDSLTEEEPGRHGAYAGRSYLQRRIVTVKLQVQAISDPSQVTSLLAQLRYDTRTLRDNTLWTLVVRGYTETLMVFGKCIDRTGVMDRDWSIGAPEPVITIECPDSRRYSLDQHSVVVPANASSATTLVNDGDLYTNPTLRFQGPATNPMLVNETLDRVLAFDITLGASDLLVVDTQLGKATIGTTDHENDLADTISVPLKEFFMDVGSSELSYETDSGGDDGVEVLWRDAYE